MIITFSTLAAWMVIDRKVNSLDNWEELSHGNILLFDNDKLIDTANFSRMNALLNDTSYII
jgi:hypothetical protein